jgi:hypothetical protein
MGGGHRDGPRIGGPSYIVTLFAAVASSLGSAAARAQTPAEQAPLGLPPVPPVAVPPPGLAAHPRPAEVPEGVFVELRVDAPGVRIDRYESDGERVAVCSAPCQRVLPRDGLYVIDGPGIRTTSRFSLPEDRRQLILDVKAGSAAQNVGGAFLIGGGVVTLFFALFAGLPPGPDAPVESSASTIGGGTREALLVGGGLAVALGAILSLTSKTTVTSSSGATFTRARVTRGPRASIAVTPHGLEF